MHDHQHLHHQHHHHPHHPLWPQDQHAREIYQKVKPPSGLQQSPQGIIARQGILEFIHPRVVRLPCPSCPRSVVKPTPTKG